jgi:molybdopterin synthase catalytic subunit
MKRGVRSTKIIQSEKNMSEILIKGPITPDIISGKLAELGNRKETGGHSVFLGQVRADIIDGKEVIAIEYSAYENMVAAEASQILGKICGDYSDVRYAGLLHSVGLVRAGEISLFVIVSAGHRDHAIRACSELVELIKQRLPVWKKEIFEDESHRWTANGQVSDEPHP